MSTNLLNRAKFETERAGQIAFWGGILFCFLFTGMLWLVGGWM